MEYEKNERDHSVEVAGYKDELPLLAERIHRMRYDAVAKFYEHTAWELRRQAQGDREKGRVKLATMLETAADEAEAQQKQFTEIWNLCEPYME